MCLFYVEHIPMETETLEFPTEESRHASRVMRKKVGDSIQVTDGKGCRIEGRISSITLHGLTLDIQSRSTLPLPIHNRIEVALGIIRPNRMDWAVEKLTELGVQKITPLICRYNSRLAVKMEHLRRVSVSALKQSRQFYLPEITEPVLFEDWLQMQNNCTGKRFIAHSVSGGNRDKHKIVFSHCVVCIGPEGGFHPEEIKLAKASKFIFLGLGATTLRTETAAVVATAKLKQYIIPTDKRDRK